MVPVVGGKLRRVRTQKRLRKRGDIPEPRHYLTVPTPCLCTPGPVRRMTLSTLAAEAKYFVALEQCLVLCLAKLSKLDKGLKKH